MRLDHSGEWQTPVDAYALVGWEMECSLHQLVTSFVGSEVGSVCGSGWFFVL